MVALHLKPGVRQFFLAWLHEHRPDLDAAYGRLYADGSYASKAYRAWLSARIRPLVARHGLPVASGEPAVTRARGGAAVVAPAPRTTPAPPALF